MKWMDYREKLGLDFSDSGKFTMLKNKIVIFMDLLEKDCDFYYSQEHLAFYLIMIGEYPRNPGAGPFFNLKCSFLDCTNMHELVSKYIAFQNSYQKAEQNGYSGNENSIIGFLEKALDDLNVSFDLLEDNDGYFVFPKGAQELDNALVSAPLEWLNVYPKSHAAFVKALKDYSEVTEPTASDVADKFRKALETFFQEIFGGGKSLENYKASYGAYLKSQGVPAEISGNFETLLQTYANFMNAYAKHHDETGLNVLEYIMYQTGNIIRLLITLKQGEISHAH